MRRRYSNGGSLRLDRCFQHVVLVADRRRGQAVEMQVGRHRRHRAAAAGVGGFFRGADRRGARRLRAGRIELRFRRGVIDEIVLQPDDELIAGLEPQRR